MDERLHLFGDYQLDLARGCLLRGRTPIHLRPQSFEVLRFLARNPGRLISKERLIEEVWQGRAVTDDSIVQCMRDVRHALGEDAGRRIRNVRGRGYIFEPAAERTASDEVEPFTERLDVISVVVDEDDGDAPAPGGGVLADAPARTPMVRTIVGAAVVVALLLVAGLGYRLTQGPAPDDRIESIAVLPLVNEAGDSEAEYLSDGLTDSIINSLSHLPGVTVKARGTVFRFKGRPVDPQRAARELSVQAVLSGRVVQRGNELTLYVSLADGRSGNQLWGEQYVRKLTDLAALQQEITRDVSEKLQGRLSRRDRQRVARDYTADPEAYLLYLRGRYHSLKTTQTDLHKGIAFYREAIDADPTYALAYSGLADAYRALSIVGQLPSTEAFPQARAAARHALELDDGLPDAYVALGWIGFSFDWKWAEAERHLRKALELNPKNPDARRAIAHLLSNLGRHDEALAEIRIARELDPLTLIVNALEGQFLFYASRFDEAEQRFRKTLDLDPGYWVAHNGLGRVYILRGMYAEAVAALTTARSLAQGSTESIPQLAYALARWGKTDEARAVLRELESLAADRYVPAYHFAVIHNGLGNRERALDYLERSFTQREVQLTFIKIDTRWDALRADPRFAAIARRMGLGS